MQEEQFGKLQSPTPCRGTPISEAQEEVHSQTKGCRELTHGDCNCECAPVVEDSGAAEAAGRRVDYGVAVSEKPDPPLYISTSINVNFRCRSGTYART